jgi:ubiquinone/menaquinone biosynthesis C-methylase UbiE
MSNPAESYESYMVPSLFGFWASYMIQISSPQQDEYVLDVGTGTGIVARHVASLVGPNGKVIGLDLNPNMLKVARAKAKQEDLNIEWHRGQAESLPFPDKSFDLVLCQFALMFFEDRNAALAQMQRVLKDDGRICLSVWQSLDRHPFYQRLHEAMHKHLGMSAIQDIFALGDEQEIRTLLTTAGFQHVDSEPVSMTSRFPNPESFLSGEIDADTAAIPSMQQLDTQRRQALISAIRTDMEMPLREITEDDHVVIPFHAYIVLAKRAQDNIRQ